MEYVLLAMVLATIGYYLLQGYREATRPPPPLRDHGGVLEPVCAKCQARLVIVTRKQGGGLADVAALLLGLIGVMLLLVNLLAGGVMLILALLVRLAGRSTVNVLTCPACGEDARVMR